MGWKGEEILGLVCGGTAVRTEGSGGDWGYFAGGTLINWLDMGANGKGGLNRTPTFKA